MKMLLNAVGEHEEDIHCHRMTPLHLQEKTILCEPKATAVVSQKGCALGIDIGSTSTDLVLMDCDGQLVDYQYLRTSGNPEAAVRKGLAAIKEKFGEVTFCAVGVTGSGRERIGRMIGADVVKDEITAQAAGAAFSVPDVDTIFEIGGQDSKFISLKDGEVVDFQMNKICAAGTGSFVEEQAARMGIPIDDFGPMALRGQAPVDLGERCTVFIETAIASAASAGVEREDIAAGLCYAIVRNYLHKVVGSKHIGEKIVLQGGVNYNPGIVAAFQTVYGENITVNPYFPSAEPWEQHFLLWKKPGMQAAVSEVLTAQRAVWWMNNSVKKSAKILSFTDNPIVFCWRAIQVFEIRRRKQWVYLSH